MRYGAVVFRPSTPVTNEAFFDRTTELKSLGARVDALRKGAPRWVTVLGERRLGKTSLLLELVRRNRHRDVRFVVLDCFEDDPLGFGIFRLLALRTVDAFFAREAGQSLELVAGRPAMYRSLLMGTRSYRALPAGLQADLQELCERPVDVKYAELALGLHEKLARALKLYCVVAWDEFQELSKLPASRGGVLKLARAIWQKHERSTYIICGSERSLLERMVTDRESPFFEQFDLMELQPMSVRDARTLLRRAAPRGRAISAAVANRVVKVLGGHPFYLQLFGDSLTAREPPYDEGLVREVFSELLFNRTGRLALYFEKRFMRLVGSASTLAATLEAVASGPLRTNEVAERTASSSGATVRYLERLGDAVRRGDDQRWYVTDPVFAMWLNWRRPGGAVMPMIVLGDEAEKDVARHLSTFGFELVYQSRASRGSFDLLAIRNGVLVGIQVKRAALPVRFKAAEWARLHSDAKRLRWRWLVAVVSPEGTVHLFAPGRRVAPVTLAQSQALPNVLAWLDGE